MGALPAPTNLLEALNGMPLPQSQDLVQGGVNTAQGRNGTSLVMHGRIWQVGSGATTTSIPILDSNGLPVLMSASMQALYTNAKFEIIQAGTVELAVVTAVGTNGTLTLDSPLSSAPSAGTAFLLTPTQQTSLSGSNTTDGNSNPQITSELFNGSTWDRQRNNMQGTLLASASRTATAISPQQTNYNSKGVLITLNVTVASGTGGLQVTVQYVDPTTGGTFAMTASPTAVTTVSENAYLLYPGATTTGGAVRSTYSQALPRSWNVAVIAGDSSSYTYSVGFSLIN